MATWTWTWQGSAASNKGTAGEVANEGNHKASQKCPTGKGIRFKPESSTWVNRKELMGALLGTDCRGSRPRMGQGSSAL